MQPQTRTHIECHDMHQKQKESLGEFLKRYMYECQKIPGLNEDQQISGAIHGIHAERHPSVVRRLRRDVPETFAKLMRVCYDYLRSGEDSEITRTCGWNKDKSYKDDHDSHQDGNRSYGGTRKNQSGGPMRNDKFRQNNQNYGSKDKYSTRRWNHENFAIVRELSKTPSEILETEAIATAFRPPMALPDDMERDTSKFCAFHNDHGHDTDRCKELIDRIINALNEGKFNHLKDGGQTSKTPKANENNDDAKTPKFAKATPGSSKITPGKKVDGAPKNEGKNFPWQKKDKTQTGYTISMVQEQQEKQSLAEEVLEDWEMIPITFSTKCAKLMDAPIVISCKEWGEGIEIPNVHVDTGSSVNIIYAQCFDKLSRRLKQQLKKTWASLSGFSGESIKPKGKMKLTIEFSDDWDSDLRRKITAEFFIMEKSADYDMLLGRSALKKLGAVASTIHGEVKFPTRYGIASISSHCKNVIDNSVWTANLEISDEPENYVINSQEDDINDSASVMTMMQVIQNFLESQEKRMLIINHERGVMAKEKCAVTERLLGKKVKDLNFPVCLVQRAEDEDET